MGKSVSNFSLLLSEDESVQISETGRPVKHTLHTPSRGGGGGRDL